MWTNGSARSRLRIVECCRNPLTGALWRKQSDRRGFIRCVKMPQGADGWKLTPHPKLPKGKKIMLIILDGWGEQIPDEFNAIHCAETPIMDHLKTVSFILCLLCSS
jgi:hypothetical protein